MSGKLWPDQWHRLIVPCMPYTSSVKGSIWARSQSQQANILVDADSKSAISFRSLFNPCQLSVRCFVYISHYIKQTSVVACITFYQVKCFLFGRSKRIITNQLVINNIYLRALKTVLCLKAFIRSKILHQIFTISSKHHIWTNHIILYLSKP